MMILCKTDKFLYKFSEIIILFLNDHPFQNHFYFIYNFCRFKMSTPKVAKNRVQVFGRKVLIIWIILIFQFVLLWIISQKTATAVALCTEGKGLIRVNGRPLHLVEPQCLRFKVIFFIKLFYNSIINHT